MKRFVLVILLLCSAAAARAQAVASPQTPAILIGTTGADTRTMPMPVVGTISVTIATITAELATGTNEIGIVRFATNTVTLAEGTRVDPNDASVGGLTAGSLPARPFGTQLYLTDNSGLQAVMTCLTTLLGDGVNGQNMVPIGAWAFNGATWDRVVGSATGGLLTSLATNTVTLAESSKVVTLATNTVTLANDATVQLATNTVTLAESSKVVTLATNTVTLNELSRVVEVNSLPALATGANEIGIVRSIELPNGIPTITDGTADTVPVAVAPIANRAYVCIQNHAATESVWIYPAALATPGMGLQVYAGSQITRAWGSGVTFSYVASTPCFITIDEEVLP
jgi:hypothetical protein